MKKSLKKWRWIRAGIFVGVILTLGILAYNWAMTFPEYAHAEISVPKHNLSPREEICQATGGENCDVIYNLCKAESGCKKYAINKNKNGTFDYSYFQINTIHIKGFGKKGTIDMDCVYNLSCSAKWVNAQIKAGHGNMWVAWKNI